MHLQPVFQGCEVVTLPRPLPTKEGSSVAEALFRDGLCLPSGTAMTQADIERVVAVVWRTHHPVKTPSLKRTACDAQTRMAGFGVSPAADSSAVVCDATPSVETDGFWCLDACPGHPLSRGWYRTPIERGRRLA